ncbi:hypothetical protein RR46_05324 [Papilio xuthus]|uniref:Uncharacterized protein n=1 Tax=Papilio xuthus TaxID=66420 RepID=A0A194Q6Q9_PAPXU|nr:hypothetical protein RR46_05324 [Papilio xuthus]
MDHRRYRRDSYQDIAGGDLFLIGQHSILDDVQDSTAQHTARVTELVK